LVRRKRRRWKGEVGISRHREEGGRKKRHKQVEKEEGGRKRERERERERE